MIDEHKEQEQDEKYEPPRVEDVPVEDGPTVTAAGFLQDADEPEGPEWRPGTRPEDGESTEPRAAT